MKKLFFSLFVLLLAGGAFAQQNKFDIGVESGPNMSYLFGNEIVERFNDPAFSFSAGFSFQYNFPKLFSIRTGPAFERKSLGSEGKFTDINGTEIGTFKARHHFDYLSLPVLFRVTFGKKIKMFANAGPYFGFLLQETTVTQLTGYPENKFDQTDQFTRFDMGATGGIGVLIPVKEKFSISCEVRNNVGLVNISALPVYDDGTIQTNSTNLLLGFAYKLGMRETK
jgi:hypothetical protein